MAELDDQVAEQRQAQPDDVVVVALDPGDERAAEPVDGEGARDLKRLCATGGSVRGGTVEIQGDHREKVAERLRADGYTVKLAGG